MPKKHLIFLISLALALTCSLKLSAGEEAGEESHVFKIHINEDDVEKVMELDAKGRAADWEATFHRLHDAYPGANIYAIIDGKSLNKVIDVNALPNGMLVEFTYLTPTGPKSLTAKIEDIEDIGVRSYRKKGVRVYMPDTNPPEDDL